MTPALRDDKETMVQTLKESQGAEQAFKLALLFFLFRERKKDERKKKEREGKEEREKEKREKEKEKY